MSNHRKEKINVNDLIQNLKDLNEITKHTNREIEEKNKILVGGLNDCKSCARRIGSNHSKRSSNTH